MYQRLIDCLGTVKSSYEKGVKITEEIFDSLKHNDIKSLPNLTKLQTDCMAEITKEKEALREFVRGVILKFNISTDEYKVQHIIHLFTQLQKEKILDMSREICEEEALLQKTLFRNQDMLSAMIRTTQTIVDTAIDYSEDEYNEGQLFLNEKF
ncbi:hypothetical protein U8V72_11125 [Priestia filamentosa]|uniref:hypothetical protein n=1 Tax=Priestia filamentosa TaxID=1402861 RepID=UPI00058945F9